MARVSKHGNEGQFQFIPDYTEFMDYTHEFASGPAVETQLS